MTNPDQAALDEKHRREHEEPTPAEQALREELLRIQNDPTLTVAQKQARMARLGAHPGPSAREDLIRRREQTQPAP